ncbi:MAG TPA: T9SS type A sorting domain-containing protein, partial [Bacteroidia bacterium]|nr:T9SS type A sorting domain-containing protein [Bacteroidia bacterium]
LIINTSGGLSSSITFASSYQTLNNLTLNVGSGKSVTLASNLAVNGTLSLSGGSNLNMTGIKLTLNGSFAGTGSLMVNDKSGIDVEASASIISPIYLSGSLGNFILNIGAGNTVTLGSDMAVDTINLKTGTLVLNSHNLSINGNIAAAGSGMLFSTSVSTVSITAATSTAGDITFSYPGNNVYNFTVNIGAAGSVTLGSDVVVNSNLIFISGFVNTGSHNLQIAASGNITGANSNAYVITSAGGYLTMNAAVSATSTFYVGTALHYSPASITLNAGSSTGTIGVNVSQGVYSQGTTGTLISASEPMVNSTWLFQTSITSGLNADMQLFWSPAMEVNGFIHTGDYISEYASGAWDKIGDSLNAIVGGGGMVSIQRKGMTSMNPTAVFDQKTITGINEIAVIGGIDIYPNPVSGNLYIKNNTGNTDLFYASIYNMLGQVVSTSTIVGTEAAIPVDGLAPGNYFIKLYNNKTTTVKKFIKI